jgi:hypothetical protein
MAAKPGFFGYVTAAFNARPLGMFVAPNWIGLGAFGLLGLINPGFWVLGAGLELGYLMILATNTRFQRLVNALPLGEATKEWNTKIQRLLGQLEPADRREYEALAERCRSIIEIQAHDAASAAGLESQADSLGRLSWMFLRLLVARRTIRQVLGASDGADLQRRVASLERQQRTETISDELRRKASWRSCGSASSSVRMQRESLPSSTPNSSASRSRSNSFASRPRSPPIPNCCRSALTKSRQPSARPGSGFAISSRCSGQWKIC